jgi:hypothetical protein
LWRRCRRKYRNKENRERIRGKFENKNITGDKKMQERKREWTKNLC